MKKRNYLWKTRKGGYSGKWMIVHFLVIDKDFMLALFKEIRQSTKLSESRLPLNVNPVPCILYILISY